MRRRSILIRGLSGIAFFVATVSAVAVAQTPPGRDAAAAEVLFRAGVEALQAQNDETACQKFEASMQLDPAVATLLQIAECHERAGALAQAWADASRALVMNRDTPGDQRRLALDAYATALVHRLEQRLPRLRVVMVNPPAGLVLRRQDVLLPNAILGEALPVDAGAVVIEASAPGYVTARREAMLVEGQITTVELTLQPSGPALGRSPEPPATPQPGGRAIPTWAWIAGGGGLLALGASAGFAMSQASTQSDIDASCPPPKALCRPGYDYRAANDRLTRDFGLFVATGALGLLAVGAAVVGIATAPHKPAATPAPAGASLSGLEPWIGPRFIGASFTGAF